MLEEQLLENERLWMICVELSVFGQVKSEQIQNLSDLNL